MPDRSGQLLGNYRLVRFLGQGGFAEVYLGEHRYLRSHAALKVLRISLSHEEAQRFLSKAQIVVDLRHIVEILFSGTCRRERDSPCILIFAADWCNHKLGAGREREDPGGSKRPGPVAMGCQDWRATGITGKRGFDP